MSGQERPLAAKVGQPPSVAQTTPHGALCAAWRVADAGVKP